MCKDVLAVIHKFSISGTPVKAVPFGGGHINKTYKVTTQEEHSADYLLQRINHNVFSDVKGLMENIYKVTAHIKKKTALGEEHVLTIVKTRDDKLYYKNGNGYWRVFEFLKGAQSFDKAQTQKHAFEGARMFGLFLKDLADFPVGELHITIKDFHNIDFRLRQFEEALKSADEDLIEQAAGQIHLVQKYSDLMSGIYNKAVSGGLPLRVTHNDTKFNNVLLNKDGMGQSVIDLDTVMPGFVFYDVGDGIRTGVINADEDEQDLDDVVLDIDKYQAYIEGYLDGTGDILTPEELKSIPYSGAYMAYIMGVRFLTDYLNGNIYYRVRFPEHNYYRSRCQLYVTSLLLEYTRTIKSLMKV
ncbi:MAG: aminoglycoside phosphotransferase family protein [Balneolaceae bacterium]|nr:aminoglycoside phosphotransferase family protein [Balneolaceae bacterium]